jgi:hypothetical protein
MSPSSSISHLPSQSTFMSTLMPSASVRLVLTFESFNGTLPMSIFVKWREDNGPGNLQTEKAISRCLKLIPGFQISIIHLLEHGLDNILDHLAASNINVRPELLHDGVEEACRSMYQSIPEFQCSIRLTCLRILHPCLQPPDAQRDLW